MKSAALVRELVEIVRRARAEGWYEEDPGWKRVDELLRELEDEDE